VRLTVGRALADYEDKLLRRALSPETIDLWVSTARRFLRFVGRVRGLTRHDVERFLAHRRTQLSPATLADETVRVRGFLRTLVELGHLPASPADDLVVARANRPPPLLLSKAAVQRLFEGALLPPRRGGEAVALRDRALLELAYGLGLRASELRAARLVDLDLLGAALLVRRAKRGYQRVLPLPPASVPHLRAWVERGRPALAARGHGRDDAYLLLNDVGGPLRHHAVQEIVTRIAARAGVAFHAHALRRALATHLVAEGVNVVAVQQVLGHERLDTTAVYVAADSAELHRAVEILERHRAEKHGGAALSVASSSRRAPGSRDLSNRTSAR